MPLKFQNQGISFNPVGETYQTPFATQEAEEAWWTGEQEKQKQALAYEQERQALQDLYQQDMLAELQGKRNRTADGKVRVWSLADQKDPNSLQYTEVADDEALGALGAGVSGFTHNIGKGAGMAAGGFLGAKAGAAIGAAVSGPAAPIGAAIGATVGGIGGMLLGGWGGTRGQRELEEQIYSPEALAKKNAIRQLAEQDHSAMSWIGGTLAEVPSFLVPVGPAAGTAFRAGKVSKAATKSFLTTRATKGVDAAYEAAQAAARTAAQKAGFGGLADEMAATVRASLEKAVKEGGSRVTASAVRKEVGRSFAQYATPRIAYKVNGQRKFGQEGYKAASERLGIERSNYEALRNELTGLREKAHALKGISPEAVSYADGRIIKVANGGKSLAEQIAEKSSALLKAEKSVKAAEHALQGTVGTKMLGNAANFAAFNAGGVGSQLAEAGIGPGDSDFWTSALASAAKGAVDGAVLGLVGAGVEGIGGAFATSNFGRGVAARLSNMPGWKGLDYMNQQRALTWIRPITGYVWGILGAAPEGFVASVANHVIEESKQAVGIRSDEPRFNWEDTWHTMAQFAFFKTLFGIKSLPAQIRAETNTLKGRVKQYKQYVKTRQEDGMDPGCIATFETYWKAQDHATFIEEMYRKSDKSKLKTFRETVEQSFAAHRKAIEMADKEPDGIRKSIYNFIAGRGDAPQGVSPDEIEYAMRRMGFPEIDIKTFAEGGEKWKGTEYGPAEPAPEPAQAPEAAPQAEQKTAPAAEAEAPAREAEERDRPLVLPPEVREQLNEAFRKTLRLYGEKESGIAIENIDQTLLKGSAVRDAALRGDENALRSAIEANGADPDVAESLARSCIRYRKAVNFFLPKDPSKREVSISAIEALMAREEAETREAAQADAKLLANYGDDTALGNIVLRLASRNGLLGEDILADPDLFGETPLFRKMLVDHLKDPATRAVFDRKVRELSGESISSEAPEEPAVQQPVEPAPERQEQAPAQAPQAAFEEPAATPAQPKPAVPVQEQEREAEPAPRQQEAAAERTAAEQRPVAEQTAPERPAPQPTAEEAGVSEILRRAIIAKGEGARKNIEERVRAYTPDSGDVDVSKVLLDPNATVGQLRETLETIDNAIAERNRNHHEEEEDCATRIAAIARKYQEAFEHRWNAESKDTPLGRAPVTREGRETGATPKALLNEMYNVLAEARIAARTKLEADAATARKGKKAGKRNAAIPDSEVNALAAQLTRGEVESILYGIDYGELEYQKKRERSKLRNERVLSEAMEEIGNRNEIGNRLRDKRNAVLARYRDSSKSVREEVAAAVDLELKDNKDPEKARLVRACAQAFIEGTAPGTVVAKDRLTKFVNNIANAVRLARTLEQVAEKYGSGRDYVAGIERKKGILEEIEADIAKTQRDLRQAKGKTERASLRSRIRGANAAAAEAKASIAEMEADAHRIFSLLLRLSAKIVPESERKAMAAKYAEAMKENLASADNLATMRNATYGSGEKPEEVLCVFLGLGKVRELFHECGIVYGFDASGYKIGSGNKEARKIKAADESKNAARGAEQGAGTEETRSEDVSTWGRRGADTGVNRRNGGAAMSVHIVTDREGGAEEGATKFETAFEKSTGIKSRAAADFLAELIETVHIRNIRPKTEKGQADKFETSLYLGQTFGRTGTDELVAKYAEEATEKGVEHLGTPYFEISAKPGTGEPPEEMLKRYFGEEYVAGMTPEEKASATEFILRNEQRIFPERNAAASEEAQSLKDDIIHALTGSDKDAKVTVGRGPESAAMRKAGANVPADSEVTGGFDSGSRELHIGENANPTTPGHELVHNLLDLVKAANPKAYEELLELRKTAPDEIRRIADAKLKRYGNLPEAVRAEEEMSFILGELASDRTSEYIKGANALAWFNNADNAVKSSVSGVNEAVRSYLASKGWISYNGPASITMDDILKKKYASASELANALWDVIEEGGRIRIARESYQSMPLDRLQALAKERGLASPANRPALVRMLTEQDKADGGARLERERKNGKNKAFSADLQEDGLSDTTESVTGGNRNVHVPRNRLSEQRDRNGLGGEPEAGERSGRLLAEASAIGRGVEGRVQESTRVRRKEAESQARLTDYAKKNGIWHDDVEHELDARYGSGEGQKNTDGGEAVVWFDRKRGVAVKAIGLDYYGSPTLALERVELHNKYFPDTKLSIVGFGEVKDLIGKNGEVELYGRPFNIIAEQPLVDSTRELTKTEIRQRLEAQGFKFLKDRGDAGLDMETPDGKAIVSDLHERNVLANRNGSTRVIDCDIRAKPANEGTVRQERTGADENVRKIRAEIWKKFADIRRKGAGFAAYSKDGKRIGRTTFKTEEGAIRDAAQREAKADLEEDLNVLVKDLEEIATADTIVKVLGSAIGEEGVTDMASAMRKLAARGEYIRDMIEAKQDVKAVVDAGLETLNGLGIKDPQSVARFQKRMLDLYAKKDILKSAEIAREVQSAIIDRIKESAARKNLAAIDRLVKGTGGNGIKKSLAKAMPQDIEGIARMDEAKVQEELANIEAAYKDAKSVEEQMALKVRESILVNAGGILKEGQELDYDRIRNARTFLEDIAQGRRDKWLEELKTRLEDHQRVLEQGLHEINPENKPIEKGGLATTKQEGPSLKRWWNRARSFVNAGATLWDMLDLRKGKDGKTQRLSGVWQELHNREGDAEEMWQSNNKLDYTAIAKIAAKYLGGKVNENGEMDEATRRKFAKEWGRSAEKGKIGRYKVVEEEVPALDADGDPVIGEDGNVVTRKVLKSVRIGDADRPMVELLTVLLHMKEAEALAKQEYTDNPEKVEGADTSLMRGLVANGYTKKLYDDLMRELPENLRNAGDELVDYLAKVGRPIAQKAYWDEYGAELRIHDRYFPLLRMNYGAAQNEFDRRSVPSILRSFMKTRTVNDYDLQPVNAFEAAVQHMRSVRQVEAYRDLVDFSKDTVLHPEFQKAMRQFTPGLETAVNNHIMRMAHGGISGLNDSLVWKMRKVMTSANVLTTSVMFKQLMSWPMMYAHLPEGVSKSEVFAEAMKLTMTDPFAVKTRQKWAKSVDEGGFPYYQFRRNGNMSFDLRVFNDVNFANKLMNSKWSPAQIMSKAVELGDALAFTNIGEATRIVQMRHEVEKYKARHDGAAPDAKAMRAIREKCNRELKRRIEMSQQSGALKDVSDAQAGPISGLFYNFATAPMAIGRMFENDLRNLANGVDVKESAFSLATIWIAQMLYQAAKDGFGVGDDEERSKERRANQVKTFLFTPLSAAMPVTSTLDYLATRATGGRTYGGWPGSTMPWTDVPESLATAVADIAKLLGLNENVHADAERIGLDITKAIGQLTGQPLGGLYKNFSGLYHAIADDDLTPGQRIMLGTGAASQYAVGAGKKSR